MIARSGPPPAKVFAPLDVAAAATTINPVGDFEFVNTAIMVINQIHSPKSQLSRMNFVQDSMSFEKSLGMLARADFERVMRLALAMTPSDVPALAQPAVCRGALVGPKKSQEENGVREKNPGRNRRGRKSERPVDRLQTGQYDTPSFLAR